MKTIKKSLLLCACLACTQFGEASATESVERLEEVAYTSSSVYPDSPNVLWYKNPSTNWMTSSLPIGNGQLGAMIFGGIKQEEVQFNEKTLCTGSPCGEDGIISEDIRGAYQNFGSLFINHPNITQATGYRRELDMEHAVARVHYNCNGVNYQREYISSYPDGVIAIHYTADKPDAISLNVFLEEGHDAPVVYQNNSISAQGKLQTVSYSSYVTMIAEGAEVSSSEKTGLSVQNADEVTIILKAGTDYDPLSPTYVSGTDVFAENIQNRVETVAEKSWESIYDAHVADFSNFFNRVKLRLTQEDNSLPTPELLVKYNENAKSGAVGPLLAEQMLYHYGRYLLISSSRGIPQPANLQGIWNHTNTPPWFADIHANINVQMNYWPAETTNLSDLHEVFLDYNYNEALIHPQWHRNAFHSKKTMIKKLYGEAEANKLTMEDAKGWVLYTGNNIFGGGGTFMMNNVSANAWNCMHFWQHYQYTQDEEFLLNKAYPVMKACCEFWMDRLIEDRGARKGSNPHILKDFAPDGTLVAPLEYSPEHGPGAEDGAAHAQQLCWDLFHNTLKAIEILGNKVAKDEAFHNELKVKFAKLDPGTHIDEDGFLREWKYSERSAGQQGHRHNSHLMGLFPGSQISLSNDSKIFNAAVKALVDRGDEGTGWSLAWKIALWARALDGEHAYALLRNILHLTYQTTNGGGWGGGTYENLLGAGPPYQIDGNFGYTAGLTEMLLQSHTDTLNLLPAIPKAWKSGNIEGLCAVGNFNVDLTWDSQRIKSAIIRSNKGNRCKVFNKHILSVQVRDLTAGTDIPVTLKNHAFGFDTQSGHSYELTFTAETPQPAVPVTLEFWYKGKKIGEEIQSYEPGTIVYDLTHLRKNAFCVYNVDRTEVVSEGQIIPVEVIWKGPFELSESYKTAKWYYMNVNSNDQTIGYMHYVKDQPISMTTEVAESFDYYWAFLGDPFHIQVVNRATGENQYLNAATDYPKMQNQADDWNLFVANASKGKFLFQDTESGQYAVYSGGSMKYSTESVQGTHFRMEEAPEIITEYAGKVQKEISPYFRSESLGEIFELPRTIAEEYLPEVSKAEITCDKETFVKLKKIIADHVIFPADGFYRFRNAGTGGYLHGKSLYRSLWCDVKDKSAKTVMELRTTMPPGDYYKEEKQFLLVQDKWCGAVNGVSSTPQLLETKSNFIQFLPLAPGKAAFAIASYNGRPGYEQYLPKGYYTATAEGKIYGSEATPQIEDIFAIWSLEKAEQVEVPLNKVGDTGYSTLYAPFALEAENADAYTLKVNGDEGILQSLDRFIPDHTPVLISGYSDKAILKITDNGGSVAEETENDLLGTLLPMDTQANQLFLGQNNGVVGFYLWDGTILEANKAYLPEITGIKAVQIQKETTGMNPSATDDPDAEWYDLTGRTVSHPKGKGIYITKGKKLYKR